MPDTDPAQQADPAEAVDDDDALEVGEATCQHEDVTSLRRTLVEASLRHQKLSDEYIGLHSTYVTAATDDQPPELGRALSAAMYGNCMAADYAYVLAGILRELYDHHRPLAIEVARRMDDMLTNGDFGDTNADVLPPAGDS